MTIALSKVTSQGQISVPAEIRKKLGIGPGSVLEWHEEDGTIVIRRAGRFSSEEIHQAVFPAGNSAIQSPPDVRQGIRQYIRRRHVRR